MVNRRRRTRAQSIMAPVGGLNDRDSIADMPIKDAIRLDNWFPSTQSVDLRGGSLEHATGLSSTGESLMPYNGIYGGAEVSKLFAASGGNIYDVTAGGLLTSTVVSGKTNPRWDHVNFANNGASYLVCVNGADLPMFYNGNTWTPSGTGYATGITGVTASTFTQVSAWKNRLFFVQKNSLSCWFLGTGAIGGAASELNFGGVAKLGGRLIATTTITTSAGSEIDDYFVAITSEGECLVYQGTDPTNISTFALKGVYRIGRPIANGSDMQGGRWLTQFGAEVVAITAEGITTLQSMFSSDVVSQDRTISDKIIRTVNEAVTKASANFGWQIILCPIQNKLIINVPTSQDVQSIQFVMNTITGAWCRFTGWNTTCFAYFKDKIYGIIGDKVYLMDVPGANDGMSETDPGKTIPAIAKTAFVYFGGRNEQKSYKLARALLLTSGTMSPNININTELADYPITGVADISTGDGSTIGVWDLSLWDSGALWGNAETIFQDWFSVNGLGYCASLKIELIADTAKCRWQGWEMQYSKGGLI